MFLVQLSKVRVGWLKFPTVSLLALLQRTPVVQVATQAEAALLRAPVGAMLKSMFAATAALGAVDTLAGATALVVSPTASPLNATAGTAIATQAMAVTGAQSTPASYTISNAMPPGLTITAGTSTVTSATTLPAIVNNATLTLSGTPTTTGTYDIKIKAWQRTNGSGDGSSTFTYRVVVTGTSNSAPAFTVQPASQSVAAGGSVTFTIAVTGTPTPTVQWQKDGTALSGQTAATLILSNVTSANAGTYAAVATNSAGTATSNGAVLTVTSASPSAPASFGAYGSGATEATASWLAPASGATVTGYKLERATSADFVSGLTTMTLATTATSYVDTTLAAGTTYYYRLSATNASGASAPTSSVTVKTLASDGTGTSTFANISTRAYCETGNGVTIGGLVVSGSATKQVLVRAIGPTLTKYGFASSEVLADPILEVYDVAGVLVDSNDNLADNANASTITTTAASLGADSLLSSDTTSSALLLTLAPGAYSLQVKGKNSTKGTVLLEAYDVATSQTTAKLVNISTRAYCTTGGGVTIGGFVITGSARKQVLVRAVGPTLMNYGLASNEVLSDPLIELHDALNNNALIATNDNLADNANAAAIVTTSARIGASAVASADTGSAAMLLTLPPGVYSFIAQGKSAAPTGIVIVEVYDAD